MQAAQAASSLAHTKSTSPPSTLKTGKEGGSITVQQKVILDVATLQQKCPDHGLEKTKNLQRLSHTRTKNCCQS